MYKEPDRSMLQLILKM